MVDREALGRLVRETWVAWAREQPAPKPSWLVPWEELAEPDREVDSRIGEALYRAGVAAERARGFEVLLYDRDDYAGHRAPESVMPRTGPRYGVRAVRVSNGATLWTGRAETHDAARALVPPGGAYFDRTGNWPSPMVPIEGWRFDVEPPIPPDPREVARAAR